MTEPDKMFHAMVFLDAHGIVYESFNDKIIVAGDCYINKHSWPLPDLSFVQVGGTFGLIDCKVDNLACLPKSIGRNFTCMRSGITSLDDLDGKIGFGVVCTGNPLAPLLFTEKAIVNGAADKIKSIGISHFSVDEDQMNAFSKELFDKGIDLPRDFFHPLIQTDQGNARQIFMIHAPALCEFFDKVRWQHIDAESKKIKEDIKPAVKFRLKEIKP